MPRRNRKPVGLPAADSPGAAPVPSTDRAPRLSDFLTPVGTFNGFPVYSLPTDPDEMARLVARRMEAQREWDARQVEQ